MMERDEFMIRPNFIVDLMFLVDECGLEERKSQLVRF